MAGHPGVSLAGAYVCLYACMCLWVLASAMGAAGVCTVGPVLRDSGKGIGGRGSALEAKRLFGACCRLRGGSSTMDDYTKMKLSDLQKELRVRGLSTKGLKNELIQRLTEHLAEAGSDAPVATVSAKREAPEPTDDGADDDQSRQKQAAVLSTQDDMGDGDTAAPVPVPLTAPPRVHVDAGGEGFVKVYNSYSIKDKCRAAGFQFDVAERAWTMSAGAVLKQLGVTSPEEVTPDAVLEMIQNTDEAVATVATLTKEPEACRAEVHDGMVRISGSTYSIKEKLRAAGFKWDGDSYTWARAEPEVSSWINKVRVAQGEEVVEAGSKEYVDAVLAAVTEVDETSQTKPLVDLDPIKPILRIKEDKVFVYKSYDIKDRLRALGFRFSSAEKAWSRPLEEVLGLSPEFEGEADVTIDKLLELEAPELPLDDAPPPPSLKVVDTEVEVYNSYAVKDQLRALGFRWNVDKACWSHNVDSVMEALGVGTQEEITIDMCTAVGENLAASGVTAPSGIKQKPELKIEGEEVQVYKSYDVKDKLRSLGFTFNADNACWRIDAMQLLERMEGHDTSTITLDDILALEPAPEMKEAPRLEIADGEALVHNSYDIKDKLRALGFRWEGSRSVWVQAVDQLKTAAGVEDESQLTIDMLLEMDAPAAGMLNSTLFLKEIVGLFYQQSYFFFDRYRRSLLTHSMPLLAVRRRAQKAVSDV